MLVLENLSKKFKQNMILDHVNYSFKEGNIYLIRGKNGVGKTVLLKLLCNLYKPTLGSIKYTNKDKDKLLYGVIIESPIFWKDKTGYETLEFLSSIRNTINKSHINDALKRVGLYDVKDMLVKKYSLGMKQKLAIAQAIMEDPAILLFDEPTNSLDDEGVDIFKKIVKEEREKGKIVIIVSHNIEDVVDICGKTLFLKNQCLNEVD